MKIDPYINFDAGTLRPTGHGEVIRRERASGDRR
jgi:CTP synthase (UTP-ammonia lyase)